MDRLTEMEAFATVVDQGGFTDAAKKMGISKSAVSKYVSSLEARLGARLLNRSTRRVSPTEIGLVYYDRACRVLNDAGEADALVSAMQSKPQGLLRIAVSTDLGAGFLSPVMAKFMQAYPEIRVQIDLSDSLSDAFKAHELVLQVGAPHDPALNGRKIAESANCMIVAPNYVARCGAPAKIDDLKSHQLLHYTGSADTAVWKLQTAQGEMREIRSTGALVANDGRSVLDACVAGLGIAYLPEFLCTPELSAGRVEEVLADLPRHADDIVAVYPKADFTEPKLRAFMDFAADELCRAPS